MYGIWTALYQLWHLYFRPHYDSKFSLTLNGKRFVILTVLFRNFCSCTRPKLYPYMSPLWKAYHQGSLPNQRVSWVQSQISVICELPHTAGTNIWIVFSVQGCFFICSCYEDWWRKGGIPVMTSDFKPHYDSKFSLALNGKRIVIPSVFFSVV